MHSSPSRRWRRYYSEEDGEVCKSPDSIWRMDNLSCHSSLPVQKLNPSSPRINVASHPVSLLNTALQAACMGPWKGSFKQGLFWHASCQSVPSRASREVSVSHRALNGHRAPLKSSKELVVHRRGILVNPGCI